jgi:acetate kinase
MHEKRGNKKSTREIEAVGHRVVHGRRILPKRSLLMGKEEIKQL